MVWLVAVVAAVGRVGPVTDPLHLTYFLVRGGIRITEGGGGRKGAWSMEGEGRVARQWLMTEERMYTGMEFDTCSVHSLANR